MTILEHQAKSRVPELVAIRHGRMMASQFAYFRGAAAPMAWDLAHTPTSDIRVQCCGDAHLLNFGMYAAPDRRLVFDVNDFDETLPARSNGTSSGWPRASRWRPVTTGSPKARSSTSCRALMKMCDQVDGDYRVRVAPPVIVRYPVHSNPGILDELREAVALYKQTLQSDRWEVLRRYYFGDFARKVVGVGSVGTEAFVVLLMGDRDDEPLFLQLKEAQESVLAPFADRAIGEFATSYADQNELDYRRLVDAVSSGRVEAIVGL